MSQENETDLCVNILFVNERITEHFSLIKAQIKEMYDVSSFDDLSITFSSPWVPPFRFINGLSKAYPQFEITVISHVDSQLAYKSFHKDGLVDVKEVPFYQKDTLQEFIWPKSL